MQNKTSIHVDWAASKYPILMSTADIFNVEVMKNFVEGHIQRMIDNDAHRAVFIQLTDVSNAISKDPVLQGRHGDEKVILEA